MSNHGNGLYEFGPYRLSAGQRLLTREGEAVALPPKTFDLLLVLVEGRGQMLAKDELIQALWPGTFVEESSLTFQIATLRKMLGEPGAGWIETVPKHGYRFAAPSPRPPSRIRWWAIAAVLAAAVAVAGVVVGRRSKTGEAPAVAAPLTAYPGMEVHPSLSPDGNQVAFAWDGPNEDNFDIYVKLVGQGEPLRLTSDRAPEFSPSWSPDGRWIAFLRGPLQGPIGIYVIPALGGAAERKLTDILQPETLLVHRDSSTNANLTWTPGSKGLAVAGVSKPGEKTAIWLVSTQDGQMRRLTEPPRSWMGDFGPVFSSDGRALAFVRQQNLSVSEILILPLASGFAPTRQPPKTAVKTWTIEAPVWTPDSRALVFSSGPPLGTRRVQQVTVAGAQRPAEVLAMGEDATTLSVARNGRIVYSRLLRDTNIWALDLDRPGSAPRRWTASTRDDHTPDYSPNGKKVVFSSTRSGAMEIWMADADGSNPVQLTNMNGPITSNPRWSPDGNTIVFDCRISGDVQLYTLNPSTRQVRRLTTQEASENEPRWSRDGRWIYFTSGRSGRPEVWKVSREGGNAVQVTRQGGFHVHESVDGGDLYFSRLGSPRSLWRMAAGGVRDVKLVEDLSMNFNYHVVKRGIYFVAERGPKRVACVRYYDFATGKITELLDTGKHWWFGLTVSPDGRRLLYSVVDSRGADLMVAERFR
jgi:Tol biopolymer transport system component/DNA-binding winged helix-turn-helix (wHTH) protein